MNVIHPTAVIYKGAILGHGNSIGPFCVIGSTAVIGNNNRFVSHVAIGGPAQHRAHGNVNGPIFIGNDNHFSEFVTVHMPTVSATTVGSRCMIMACAHVSHDSEVQDEVTLSNNVLLGGHTVVMCGATIGLGAVIHQWQLIGHHSMIGMGSVVPKKTPIRPGAVYAGNPIRFVKINSVGLERCGKSQEELSKLLAEYDRRLEKK